MKLLMKKTFTLIFACIIFVVPIGVEAAISGGQGTSTLTVVTKANWKKPGSESITLSNRQVVVQGYKRTLPYQRRYLFNVIPLDVYQEAQKDNFERLKLNPNATYVEVDRDFAEKILMLVNKERTQRGLRALRLSTDLQSGAAIRAKELTIFYDHTRPNGEPCYTMINKKGYGIGENIAAGQRSAEEVMLSWMNSTGHRRNILDPQFKELGVGYILKENDAKGYRHYWVQIFRG